ncbi:MAG: glucose-6-phosphate isomerase family protein [Candidatus Micrarchaeaceae archaeon]
MGRKLNPRSADVMLDGCSSLSCDGVAIKPGIRRLKDIEEVLADRGAAKGLDRNMPLYYMFRAVGSKKYGEFKAHNLRYDITVILDCMIGDEFNKTLGHYHPEAEKGLAYPEIYEVIDGSALFIFQRETDGATDVKLIDANKGDKILIPPNYGHVTVNNGRKELVLANLVADNFESDYKSIIKKAGAAVYAIGNGGLLLNQRYGDVFVSRIDKLKIKNMQKGSLMDRFLDDPGAFGFLNKPSLPFKML